MKRQAEFTNIYKDLIVQIFSRNFLENVVKYWLRKMTEIER